MEEGTNMIREAVYLEILWRQRNEWAVPSSGMWRRVDLVRTDTSKERVASIFRVEKIREREKC
jgi:hypothetical protein